MKLSPFAQKLADSLAENDTAVNRRKWAKYLVKNKIPLKELLPILYLEGKPASRFSFMLGDLSCLEPAYVHPHIAAMFKAKEKIKVVNFNRTLARMMDLCGIPPGIEGKAVDALISWIIDPTEIMSCKVYAMNAMLVICKKYPELKGELADAIRSQVGFIPGVFDNYAKKMLEKLGEGEIN